MLTWSPAPSAFRDVRCPKARTKPPKANPWLINMWGGHFRAAGWERHHPIKYSDWLNYYLGSTQGPPFCREQPVEICVFIHPKITGFLKLPKLKISRHGKTMCNTCTYIPAIALQIVIFWEVRLPCWDQYQWLKVRASWRWCGQSMQGGT